MKAITYTRYGTSDIPELKEVEKPFPEDNEVLIKVRATTEQLYFKAKLRRECLNVG